MNHTILLVMQNFAGMGNLILKNLKHSGFDADFIFFDEVEKFRYKNIFHKVKTFYHKNILKDKNYKDNLRKEFRNKKLFEKAQLSKKYDTILVINAEYFQENFLLELSKHTNNFVGFHWDGIKRTPEIVSKISIFRKFYVFDKADNFYSNTEFLTNFYFDFPEENDQELKHNLLYIGTFVKERFKKILKIIEIFKKINKQTKIILVTLDKKVIKEHQNSSLDLRRSLLTYDENINLVKNSQVLLDLKLKEHNGLSFRFFEAMKYKKKLITDNSTVKEYDFFCPENIFVLESNNVEELQNFIEKPYTEINKSIFEKYSFTNWIKTITKNDE